MADNAKNAIRNIGSHTSPVLWLLDMLTNESERGSGSHDASRSGIEDQLRDKRWIRPVLTGRENNNRFVLAQRRHRVGIQVQVRLHEFRWRQAHPLVQRQVGKAVAAKHL